MKNKSILLCVATEKGFSVLKGVNEHLQNLIFHVCTFKEKKVVEKYYEKICSYTQANNLFLYPWKDIKKGSLNWLKEKNIYAIVCVGWRYLIPNEIIDFVEGRVLVTHDSLIPKYRGFAPLASALINGEKEVGITVMLAGKGVDTGNIIYQGKVSVDKKDKIKDLTKKLLPLFVKGIVTSLQKMFNKTLESIPQDHSKATYSIWRDENDLLINWNNSADQIERIVRALGHPYMGARTYLKEDVVIIHDADVMPDLTFEIRQPGKVWELSSKGEPIVICGKGMLIIKNATINNNPLVPLKKLRVRFY